MDDLATANLLLDVDGIFDQSMQGVVLDLVLSIGEHVEQLGEADVTVRLLSHFVMSEELPLVNYDAFDAGDAESEAVLLGLTHLKHACLL